MSPSHLALLIISAIVGIASAAGFYAGSRYKMDLEQWTVAGRGFGVVLVWLLMAGEFYTTFTFLGASGWAYSRGAPAFYIIAYQPLCFAASFYFLPALWEVGRKHHLQTQGDFFQLRYGSRYLTALVSLIGFIFIIPYVQLQLTGLGIIVQVASFGQVARGPAIAVAFSLVAAFVFVSGVRGVAWVSVVKDLLLLGVAVFLGFAIPHMYFHGIGPMFAALARVRPEHLVMPGATKNLGHAWFASSALLSALGVYMWPHMFAASFTARSGDIVRRNAVFMPLYGITMPLMFIVGFTALLALPGLRNGDLSLLTIVRQTFPAWLLGIVGGAGALTAMVPASILVLAAATLFSKNVFRPMFAPQMTDAQTARLAKTMVLVIIGAAVISTLYTHATLVSLLLLGFSGVTQFLPGVVLGLFSNRVTTAAVAAGLLVGIAIVAALTLTGRDPFLGLNAGFIALVCNFLVVAVVSVLIPMPAKTASPALISVAITSNES